MPKVGIYCRLSVEDDDKGTDESQSIQNQKAMLRDYCIERGWEIYDIYADDGYSGIDRTRPAFNRLLRDCEQRSIDIVLCKDQSRFSRDTVVIDQYLNDKFLEWGIRFIGVADNADTDNESYGTMRLFTSAYNEMYVKDISAKIRRTLAYKREQGQFIGSFAPYGYLIDPTDKHHLIVDTETAPVVRMIFYLYVSGDGYRQIVQKLNNDGIVSPSAYKRQHGSNYINCNADSGNASGMWTQSTVARMLANETYTGTLVQGKSHHISYKNKKRKKVDAADWVRIPNAHEAIIDADTWARTQARLSSNTRVGSRMQELSPLSGKVRCAVCGKPMKRNVYYNKSRTIKYYGLQCATYKTGAMNCPNVRTISGKVLEQTILDELNSIVSQYCQADEISFTNHYEEQLRTLESTLAKLNEKHASSQKRLVQMYKDKLDGILSDADYALFRQNLADEEHALTQRIAEVRQQITETRERMENSAGQKALIEQYTHFDTLDRTVADEFIDRVEIGMTDDSGEREIHIHWKI
ncbi:MAG: recombinase family protein [Oscillospiraceae bacterium]|nr:recombinase family protein [Oscillospiraceae bacterium]